MYSHRSTGFIVNVLEYLVGNSTAHSFRFEGYKIFFCGIEVGSWVEEKSGYPIFNFYMDGGFQYVNNKQVHERHQILEHVFGYPKYNTAPRCPDAKLVIYAGRVEYQKVFNRKTFIADVWFNYDSWNIHYTDHDGQIGVMSYFAPRSNPAEEVGYERARMIICTSFPNDWKPAIRIVNGSWLI
jgi:hypothetical protein